MNRQKLLSLGILALILAACGGSAAVDPTATAAPPTATPPPAEPTATEAPPEPTATAAEPTATVAPEEPEEEASDDGDGGEAPEATEEVVVADAGDPAAGEEHFSHVCAACHGPGGEGIQGLGKDLTTSEFVAGLSDQELLAFIQEGRPVDHPDNTTGVAMPPRGGSPGLSDEDLLDIIAYIRTLQEE